jgi:hypothetical protein
MSHARAAYVAPAGHEPAMVRHLIKTTTPAVPVCSCIGGWGVVTADKGVRAELERRAQGFDERPTGPVAGQNHTIAARRPENRGCGRAG